MEILTIHVHRCILKVKGIVPLPLALFTVHNTDRNTDGLKPLMYSRGEGNYSHPLGIVHYAQQ